MAKIAMADGEKSAEEKEKAAKAKAKRKAAEEKEKAAEEKAEAEFAAWVGECSPDYLRSNHAARFRRRLHRIPGETPSERKWQERCWQQPDHGGYTPAFLDAEGMVWDEELKDFRKK